MRLFYALYVKNRNEMLTCFEVQRKVTEDCKRCRWQIAAPTDMS